ADSINQSFSKVTRWMKNDEREAKKDETDCNQKTNFRDRGAAFHNPAGKLCEQSRDERATPFSDDVCQVSHSS
ncbi:MAG: hypothetical protein KDJ31_12445, partial [Candidatus Competibacteraceae bacterium]|nr:hypothetical protein [Candidatus Competibacteraceae bacterium]